MISRSTLFEDWKKRVTKISDSCKIALWDFSGYSAITTEKVQTPMKNYWDSSHFTEIIGKRILDQCLRNQSEGPFGIRIKVENIEEHLKSINLDREVYISLDLKETMNRTAQFKRIFLGEQFDKSQSIGLFDVSPE